MSMRQTRPASRQRRGPSASEAGSARASGTSRTATASRPRTASPDRPLRLRLGVGRVIMLVALAVVALQLLWVQSISAPSLSAQAASQRTTREPEYATRGPITDRNGKSSRSH